MAEPIRHDCSGTTRAAATFLAGSLSAAEVAAVREHRRSCPDCDQTWRQTVAAAASMQSGRRRQRLTEERRQRREQQRARALAGMALQTSGRRSSMPAGQRRAHLRLILWPTVAVVLMLVIYPMRFGRGARLEVLAGAVDLTANVFGVQDAPVPLVRGDQAATDAEGRARIDCASAVVELGGLTYLVVEDADEGRFRLDGGSLEIDGDCTVTTRYGVIETRGARASLRAVEGGVELATHAGRVLAINSEGQLVVAPGTRAVLGHPR